MYWSACLANARSFGLHIAKVPPPSPPSPQATARAAHACARQQIQLKRQRKQQQNGSETPAKASHHHHGRHHVHPNGTPAPASDPTEAAVRQEDHTPAPKSSRHAPVADQTPLQQSSLPTDGATLFDACCDAATQAVQNAHADHMSMGVCVEKAEQTVRAAGANDRQSKAMARKQEARGRCLSGTLSSPLGDRRPTPACLCPNPSAHRPSG